MTMTMTQHSLLTNHYQVTKIERGLRMEASFAHNTTHEYGSRFGKKLKRPASSLLMINKHGVNHISVFL